MEYLQVIASPNNSHDGALLPTVLTDGVMEGELRRWPQNRDRSGTANQERWNVTVNRTRNLEYLWDSL